MKDVICSWNPVSNVNGYNVYLKSNGVFEKQNVDLIVGLEYTIANLADGVYEAYATAVREGLESAASNIAEITITEDSLITENRFAHFDADAITGLANEDPVSLWEDLSGNNYDIAQATPADQPTYIASAINGKPSVRFNGSSETLESAAFATPFSQPVTMYAVINTVGTGTQAIIDAATGDRLAFYYDSSNIEWRINAGSGVGFGEVDPTGLALFTLYFNGSQSFMYRNGVAEASNINAGTRDYASILLGSFSFGGSFFNGDIGELVFYDTLHSASDRESNEAFLASKWGITLP